MSIAPMSQPRVIAHRGGAGLRPENTLAAFENAIALGVDGVELDVQLSADGQVVVYHDERLNPALTRDARGDYVEAPAPNVSDLTVSQLKRFDIGRIDPSHAYARSYPNQVPFDGQSVPTLGEVLSLAKRNAPPEFELWVEIKARGTRASIEALTQRTVETIRRSDPCSALVLCFNPYALAVARRMAPALRRVHSVGEDSLVWLPDLVFLSYVRASRGTYWFPHHRRLGSTSLRWARRLGLKVATWTPNAEHDLSRLMASGVDAICTDYPDRLLRLFP